MKHSHDTRRSLDALDIERIRIRSLILRATHDFFADEGYLEIHPPVLVPAPGMEPHIEAMSVTAEHTSMFLQTSPEFALKTLLGRGMKDIYALTPCFRDEPLSRTHCPQFMMLEWYRVGASLMQLMAETEALLKHIVQRCSGVLNDEAVVLLKQPFKRMTVQEAFVTWAQIDPWELVDASRFRSAAQDKGIPISPQSASWDEIFFDIFMNVVEPQLEEEGPIFLWGWPRSQAALSRLDPDDPTRALRFELYAGGLELANAFDELVDAVEQRARFEMEQGERRGADRPVYPIDERLLSAINHMTPTAGIALGFDRLVMLLTGAEHIEEVLAW